MIVRSVLFAAAFYGVTALMAIAGLPVLLMPRRALDRYGLLWVRLALAMARVILRIEVEVRGRENIPDGPAIYASKHQSAWDTLIFNVLVPHAVYVMKKELFLIPLWGWYVRRRGMVGIDRKGGAGAIRGMIRDIRRALAEGHSVVYFPQGSRTPPGAKRPYLRGIGALYLSTDAPIVPVALNSGLFWPRRAIGKRAGTIVVSFLPPLEGGLGRNEVLPALESRIEPETARLEAEARRRFRLAE